VEGIANGRDKNHGNSENPGQRISGVAVEHRSTG
jgi:hypothetical protein